MGSKKAAFYDSLKDTGQADKQRRDKEAIRRFAMQVPGTALAGME